jgi:hypothetical protein
MYDWLLFLHVLMGTALFGTVVIFSAFALGAPIDARVLSVGNVLWAIGALGTLVFGIWLAIYVNDYEPWDGWIVGAIVLWAISMELGRRAQLAFTPATEDAAGTRGAAAGNGNLMHWLRTLLVLGLLVVMIYKPGA